MTVGSDCARIGDRCHVRHDSRSGQWNIDRGRNIRARADAEQSRHRWNDGNCPGGG